MAKMDLAKVRATIVNIMRSCVCGDVVDKMNNYLFRYFVCLTFCRPLPPQSASMRVVVDPNLAPQAPPQKRHAKKNIYFLKESNENKNCQAGPGRVLGRCQLEPQKAGWHFPEVLQ